MTGSYPVTVTRARVLRHAPTSSQGFEAAVIDIAQDLLLRHLHDVGLLTELAFKGGTALRSCTPAPPAASPSTWTSRSPRSAPTLRRCSGCSPSSWTR
jgi:hypothetical protein